MDKKHCVGCRNNFYNGNNDIGVSECWSLKNAKLKTRYSIGWWTPTLKENFIKVRVPSCYHQNGSVFYTDSIASYPSGAK